MHHITWIWNDVLNRRDLSTAPHTITQNLTQFVINKRLSYQLTCEHCWKYSNPTFLLSYPIWKILLLQRLMNTWDWLILSTLCCGVKCYIYSPGFGWQRIISERFITKKKKKLTENKSPKICDYFSVALFSLASPVYTVAKRICVIVYLYQIHRLLSFPT